MFRFTIERLPQSGEEEFGKLDPVKLYEQTVTEIDLPKIIQAINTPPRPPRVRRKRGATMAEAGKP